MTTTTTLTAQSLELFLAYVEDAPNWGGTPLFNGNVCMNGEKADRGNLTQLKKAGLVQTNTEEGNTWIYFTAAGVALANQHGLDPINGRIAPTTAPGETHG